MKLSPAIFWMVGGISILVGVGLWAYQRLGPTPIAEPLSPDQLSEFEAEISHMPAVPISIPQATPTVDDMVAAQVSPTPIPDPLNYDGLLFRDGIPTRMIFHLSHGGYVTPEFKVYQWTPGIFDTGIFDVGKGTAVAYVDNGGRLILLAHSGLDQTMSPIQNYIELSESGYRETVAIASMRLDEMRINASQVYISQGEDFQYSQVAAAVRVPPESVTETSLHIMDLVPFLAETYPDSGFDKLVHREDAIILYFCGRALATESPNPSFGFWTQARFVIGMVPAEEIDGVQ